MAADSFIWRCPGCDKKYRIKTGKKPPLICPTCEANDEDRFHKEFLAVMAPAPEPEPTFIAIDPPPKPEKPPKPVVVVEEFTVPGPSHAERVGRSVLAIWQWALPVGLLFGIWSTWQSPPGWEWAVSQLSVIGLIVWAVTRFKRVRWFTWGWRLVIALALPWWACPYVHNHAWHIERAETADLRRLLYQTRSGVPFKATLESTASVLDKSWWSATGPYTETGKLHGRWHRVHSFSSGLPDNDEWYWYGEAITEGEWVLRNKK